MLFALLAVAALMVGGHIFLRARQRKLAARRPNLSEADFLSTVQSHRRDIGFEVYREFTRYCGTGIRPNPSDDLETFYALDDDEVSDVMTDLVERLGFAPPAGPGSVEPPRNLAEMVDILGSLRAAARG